MINLRGISTNWFKNRLYVPPQGFLGYGLWIAREHLFFFLGGGDDSTIVMKKLLIKYIYEL